jgi:choline dehydrogenase
MFSTTYDYIIIGAGSAGCVLAEQLSQDSSLKILIIEAGGADKNFLFHLPIGWAEVAYSPKYNWGYRTEKEARIGQRPMIWPRAKVLGGCSSTNGLVIVRGQADDYDDWAALGNKGWSWSEVLPYFKALETYHHTPHASRGTQGLLHVNKARTSTLSEYFLDACVTVGIPRVDDVNQGDQFGAAYFDVNIHRGKRQSAATCFLSPALARGNVTLMTDTEVSRIALANGVAEGVYIHRDGEDILIRANAEVCLCAGAINSPLLLEKSGIGQRERLEQVGIPCQLNLPGVGENLQDHLGAMVSYQVTIKDTINDQFTLTGIAKHVWQYIRHKKGLLSYPSSDVVVFLKSEPSLTRPDLQIHFTPASGVRDVDGKSIMDKTSGITAMIYPTRPASRGHVHLAQTTSQQSCTIQPNYLTCEEDRAITRRGIALLREIFNAEPMAKVALKELRPGADVISDEALMQYVANTSTTSYHPVGTCKMGHDDLAVVDDQLRVHGIERLRVIDASIMPTICSANTNAAAMMIAMRGAALIRDTLKGGNL